MLHYARIIQECQYDLGRPISSFPNIGMSDLSFSRQIAQKDDNNNNNNQEQEESQTDHEYEQERLTDAYSEDFRDEQTGLLHRGH